MTPAGDTLLDRLRRWSQTRTDRPWIVYGGRTVSFGEADRTSDALASAFVDLGVRPGDRIAVCLHNVPQWPLAALAAWKCGASVVALSTLLRAGEAAKQLADSGARVLLVDDLHWRDVLDDAAVRELVETIVTTSPLAFAGDRPARALTGAAPVRAPGTLDLEDLIANPSQRPSLTVAPSDVAYLTYTSGTTGPAKAACNTHANVAAGGVVYRDSANIGDDDVVAALAPLFHVTGITGHVAVSLTAGVPMLLGYRFDADEVVQQLADGGATFTVAAITALLAILNAPTRSRHDLSALRKVWSGGQSVAAATVELIERELGTYVRIAYGMTETTYPTHLVPHDRRAPVDPATGTLAVGLPTPGVSSWILDDDGRTLGDGQLGEIVVRGPGIVPGYWQRPEETEAAMPGGALRTGDVGYRDADGWFYVVDRKKDLINTSGFKVWPREVEDVLYGHPAVREVAVVGRPDVERGEIVAAFVSLRPDAQLEPAELIAWTRDRLAAHKRPRSVEIVDDVPKTVTGKVLRRELRERKP
jgi:long-chain acyl-CoA synthetase